MCFLEFLKVVHLMLVGLLSLNSYQSIFFPLSFFFFDIQYTVQNSFNYSQEVKLPSKYTQMYKGKFAEICYICHHFEYQTDPLWWERSVTFTLFFLVNY